MKKTKSGDDKEQDKRKRRKKNYDKWVIRRCRDRPPEGGNKRAWRALFPEWPSPPTAHCRAAPKKNLNWFSSIFLGVFLDNFPFLLYTFFFYLYSFIVFCVFKTTVFFLAFFLFILYFIFLTRFENSKSSISYMFQSDIEW